MLDEVEVRREKREKLRELGLEAYPVEPARNATCAEALAAFEAWESERREVVLAGRIMAIRVLGGMMFAPIMDDSGRLQLAFKQDDIGEETFGRFRDLIDPGDIVEATGTLTVTKRGEKSLAVASWRVLAKALLPLPEKFHGLQDVETRYRERELDLLTNPDVKKTFVLRSKLIASLRSFLASQDFMEVETPMLHPIAGGANARPFVTHHNALDVDLYLRIAPELYLKRLLVGGFEKIFEIGRCFRNEGIDYAHNPEFTQIELYWAYAGKDRFLAFMREMVTQMIQDANGSLRIEHEDGVIDFSGEWEQTTFRDAVKDACGIDIDKLKTPKDVEAAAKKAKIDVDFSSSVGLGEYLDELFKKTARAKMAGEKPIWVLDYPIELKPLANRKPGEPTKSATAQLIVRGAEIINAYYYELNDPEDQRRRFEEQQALREKGSEEAQPMDEGFVRALEHGMPPASGMGMGIDRLTALVAGAHSLKEVILFPTLRPKS